MRALLLALQFLTILPLPRVQPQPRHFGPAMMFFPLVGLLLGGLLVGCHAALHYLSPGFPANLRAFTLTLLLALATRALHLEGLSDFLDGFLGGHDAPAVLRIMKDSRAGAFGVIGLVFVILGKFLCILHLLGAQKEAWLLLFPVLSRWSMLAVSISMPDPRCQAGLAGPFLQTFRWSHLVVGTVGTVVLMFIFADHRVVTPVLAALAVVAFMRRLTLKRIGGITGDVIGATCELSELAVLFAIAS